MIKAVRCLLQSKSRKFFGCCAELHGRAHGPRTPDTSVTGDNRWACPAKSAARLGVPNQYFNSGWARPSLAELLKKIGKLVGALLLQFPFWVRVFLGQVPFSEKGKKTSPRHKKNSIYTSVQRYKWQRRGDSGVHTKRTHQSDSLLISSKSSEASELAPSEMGSVMNCLDLDFPFEAIDLAAAMVLSHRLAESEKGQDEGSSTTPAPEDHPISPVVEIKTA
ncbi:hypothetical protein B0H11DRAFT_2210628 [Mycena galericulata]|nr:hypothetical protein B0H11DRAFT_2210628 [Mycena galericulata]